VNSAAGLCAIVHCPKLSRTCGVSMTPALSQTFAPNKPDLNRVDHLGASHVEASLPQQEV